MNEETIKEGKNLAVICYLTFVGLIIAMIMNLDKKNSFTTFHARQMLGLIIMLLFSNITMEFVNLTLGWAFWLITFVFWLTGLINASQGKAKTIPFLGDLFQKWFKNIN